MTKKKELTDDEQKDLEVQKLLDSMESVVADLTPNLRQAPDRMRLNVGHQTDLATGDYEIGYNGRYVLNGGLQQSTGIMALPNTLKSTWMHTMTCSAVDKMAQNGVLSPITTNDTENSSERKRLLAIAWQYPMLKKLGDLFDKGLWLLTTKSNSNATTFWKEVKDTLVSKSKNKKMMVETPLADVSGKRISLPIPTIYHIDSLTTWDDDAVQEVQDKVDLADSKGFMVFMKGGQSKARFLTALPRIMEDSNSYWILTAHVGERGAEMGGPMFGAPDKKIPTMKANQKVKGVTDNFFSLTSGIWQPHRLKPLYAEKRPMYPIDSNDNGLLDTDLIELTTQMMRSKTSQDGPIIKHVVSKNEGFLEHLGLYHSLKDEKYWGMDGSPRFHNLFIYPTAKLSRTKIRSMITEDSRLRRALEITDDMYKIFRYRKYPDRKMICTAEQLFMKLTEDGYDWDKILDSRGWYAVGTPPKGVITVTTLDLLAMYADYGGAWEMPELKK